MPHFQAQRSLVYITSSDIIFVIVIRANKVSSLSLQTVVFAIPVINMHKYRKL